MSDNPLPFSRRDPATDPPPETVPVEPPPVIIQGQEPPAATATPLMGSPNPSPPPAPLDVEPGSSAALQLEAPPAEQLHARLVRLEKLVEYLMSASHRFAPILAETEHLLHVGQ